MDSLKIITAASLLSLVWGCGSKYIVVASDPKLETNPPGRIAILPLVIDDGADRPGRPIVSGTVEEAGPGVVADLLYHNLEHYSGLDLIPRESAEAVAGNIRRDHPDWPLAEQARRAGEDLDAPEVLTGRITSFTERVGSAYGIERPPTVGFELYLTDTSSGIVLWKGSYFETQQSLFSDLSTFPLFIRRGGKWVTAKDLAEYGVVELLSDPVWKKVR